MHTNPSSTTIASAESHALNIQAAEAQAEERFDAVRAKLKSAGRAEEATSSSEFRDWMQARATTDDAWGRWAQAMDAAA
jgi:hypothetical protein